MRIGTVFSENMRKYRKEAKLSQEKLAEMCDTDYRYIGMIETGKRCPSLEYVERIATALNVSPHVLFYDQDDNGNDEAVTLSREQRQKLKAMLFESFAKACSIIDGKK